MTEEERIRIAEVNLSRLLDWVGRIDAKSSVVLGINTAMLGVLASLAPAPHLWAARTVILGIVSVLLCAATFVCIYLVNYPRTKGPTTSLNFFGGIASRTFREYEKAFMHLASAEYLSDVLEQCHKNAEIVKLKFAALKWAYRFLMTAIVPWCLCLYYFKVVTDSH
jgi:hypothetical protein